MRNVRVIICWLDYFRAIDGDVYIVDDFGNLVAISPILFDNFAVYFEGSTDGH